MKLNHVRWTLIYLLCILFSLMFAPIGKANDTTQVKRPVIVKYRLKVLDNYVQYLQVRRMIYGEGQKKKKTARLLEIPEPQPSPHQACFEVQRRKHRNRQHRVQLATAQGKAASRLAHALWRQDARRSYRASAQSPQGKRALYRPDGPLSLRGTA